LNFRLNLKNYESPMENFIKSIEKCLNLVKSRTHENLLTDECPANNLFYNDIFILIKFTRILDNINDKVKA